MPKTSEQNAQIRSDTQNRILQAATDLFATEGYTSTSIRRIATECGISLGLMYNYFDSKEILLKMIIAQSLSNIQLALEISEEFLPPKKIEALVTNLLTSVTGNPNLWKLTHSMRIQTSSVNDIGNSITAIHRLVLNQMLSYFEELNSTDALIDAHILFSTIEGICLSYAMDPLNYPMEKIRKQLLEKFAA